jgi:cytidine deaminase
MPGPKIKLCIIAPAGSGKSTVARLICERAQERGLSCAVIKLAEPLYDIQAKFYDTAKVSIGRYQQNHGLLESIADYLRSIDKWSIANHFKERYLATEADIVINDDLRDSDIDWPVLQELGFSVLYVEASEIIRHTRLQGRGDLEVSATSKLDAIIKRIPVDFTIDNSSESLEELIETVDELFDTYLSAYECLS